MFVTPLLIPILALMIPIIAIASRMIVTPWFELQRERLKVDAQMTAEKAAQYAAQTERLEARVRVLERIVTDKGVALADEIDGLRDRPAALPSDADRPLN